MGPGQGPQRAGGVRRPRGRVARARQPVHHGHEGGLSAQYADGLELLCRTTERGFGVRFEGSEGWVDFSWKGLQTFPASLKQSKIGPQETHLPLAVPEDPDNKANQSRSYNHVRNFVQCVKSRRDPVEPVEAGHRTASLCHLGNIAMKLRRKIRWDPEQEQIVDDDEAAKFLSRPVQAPWRL